MKSISILTGRFLTGMLLLISLFVFEFVNYTTNVGAVESILGSRSVGLLFYGQVSFAVLVGLAFCLVDFSGIARIFTPQRGKDEPNAVRVLFIVWLLSAVLNAGLTWWVATIWVASSYGGQNPLVNYNTVLVWAPRIIATLFFLVHFGLVYTVALVGDDLFSSSGAPRKANFGAKRPSIMDKLFKKNSVPKADKSRFIPPKPKATIPQLSRREEIERDIKAGKFGSGATVPTAIIGGDKLEF